MWDVVRRDGAGRCIMRRARVRRTGTPAVLGAAAAVLSCPLLFVAMFFLLDTLSWKILEADLISYISAGYGLPKNSVLAVVLTSIVILSYLLSRLLHARIVYRRVLDDAPKCEGCGYNLTGNRSGRCPECGELVEPTRRSADG